MKAAWKHMADWPGDPWWFKLLDGALLVGLLACFAAGERFDAARTTRRTLEQSARVNDAARDAATGDLLLTMWTVTFFVGLLCAVWVALRTYAITRAELKESRTRADRRRIAVLAFALTVAILLWAGWQGKGRRTFGDPDAGSVVFLAAGAVLAALVAVATAGQGVVGDPRRAWRRASVVRIQLIVLGGLFAVVFVVPFTSAQMFDVLRAWGDRPHSRAMAGIAGALLLGAVCRAGARRILVPDDDLHTIDRRVAALVALPVIAVLVCLEAWLMIGVVLFAAAIVSITKRVDPEAEGGPLADDPDAKSGVRQLAGTLGVIPLGTLLAGLVGATVDSLLLPTRASKEDWTLVGWSLVVCGICGALAVVTHRRRGAARPRAARIARLRGWVLATVLAGVGALAALGVSLLPGEWLRFAAGGVLVVVAAVLAFGVLGDEDGPELWGAAGVVAGMAVAIYAEPIQAPRATGAIANAFIACAGILLVLCVLASAAGRLAFKSSWAVLPSRVPVVSLVAVWILVAWHVTADEFHQVRTVPAGDRQPKALGTAVFGWLDRQWKAEVRARESTKAAERAQIEWPMVLVAASGGGSKAAYWTDLVLDCALGRAKTSANAPYECRRSPRARARYRRLFLTSSVSGGSVGVRHFIARRRSMLKGMRWVDDAAGPEVLSPVVAWGLFHDLPVFMAGMSTDPRNCRDASSCRREADRALVQESAIAGREAIDPHAGRGLLAPVDDPPSPVTVFNGTQDGGNARVLASQLALAPRRLLDHGCPAPPNRGPAAGSIDAHDVLERGEDVTRVTAAVLSARFPFVEPAGRLGDAEVTPGASACRPPPPTPLPPVLVRDGGYIENSGLLTVAELLPDLARRVRRWRQLRERPNVRVKFLVVSIDDDPIVLDADPTLRTRPRDALGIRKQAGPDYITQRTRDRLESCRFRNVDYMRISPPPHVGAQAATGWELSRTVRRDDLAAALRTRNPAARRIRKLRRILDGEPISACMTVG